MNLVKLVPPDAYLWCENVKDRPAVYDDVDSDDAVIQGDVIIDQAIVLPDGEGRIRVPKALLRSLAAQLTKL